MARHFAGRRHTGDDLQERIRKHNSNHLQSGGSAVRACQRNESLIFAASMANMTYEELLKKHPGSLVEKIVTEVLTKDTVDVYFEDEGDEQWAVIKVHIYEEDKEMALRLLSDNRWILQFGYYDDEDEFIELLQPLTQLEIDLIPKGLQKVMLKVVTSEEGLRLPGNFLSR